MQKIENSSFLKALAGNNEENVPVWFMRQAGRFLPSYQIFRKKHSLFELFFTPELAAKITMLPVDELGVDAAIVFSDITVIALTLGLSLEFQEGPKIFPLLDLDDIKKINYFNLDSLNPIFETISLVKKELKVPLIGFCGAPFTVASYLVQGGESGLKKMMQKDPVSMYQFFDHLTKISILYLEEQKKAGIQAFQLFDTWVSLLSREEFLKFAKPFYRKIFDQIDLPGILFGKSLSNYLDLVLDLPCALSLDSTLFLPKIREKTTKTLQGNLDPDLLLQPLETIENEVRMLKKAMGKDPAWILNLGHGIKPNTSVASVKKVIEINRL